MKRAFRPVDLPADAPRDFPAAAGRELFAPRSRASSSPGRGCRSSLRDPCAFTSLGQWNSETVIAEFHPRRQSGICCGVAEVVTDVSEEGSFRLQFFGNGDGFVE